MHYDQAIISIIIPHYNDISGLTRCLESLACQNAHNAPHEIICVDNGSDSPIPNKLKELWPQVIFLEEPKAGPSAARNTGARHAKGEIFIFLDSDTWVESDWLARGLELFQKLSEHTLMSGPIINVLESRHSNLVEKYDHYFHLRQDYFMRTHGFFASAHLWLHKKLFDKVGGFDERVLSGQDKAFSYYIQKAGGTLKYEPSLPVNHRCDKTLSSWIRKAKRYGYGEALGTIHCHMKTTTKTRINRYLETIHRVLSNEISENIPTRLMLLGMLFAEQVIITYTRLLCLKTGRIPKNIGGFGRQST